jgi:CheY-like chemotaxis protein
LPAGQYVLVVEDDTAIRTALVDVLAGEGMSVRTAGDGQQALDVIAGAGPPALILLDLMMPGMDGPTFLSHQRAEPSLAEIPVVLMTASHRGELSHLKPAALLRKPFTIHQLLTMLAPWIARQAG